MSIQVDLLYIVQSVLVVVIGFMLQRFIRSAMNAKEVLEIQVESLLAALNEMPDEWSSKVFRETFDRHYQQRIEAKRLRIGS